MTASVAAVARPADRRLGTLSASFGDGEAGVVLGGNRGETISGPGSSWRRLPALPGGQRVTLALPGGGVTEALAANAGTLTVWRLAATRAPG